MTTTRRNQTVVSRLQPGTIDWTDDEQRPCTNLAERTRAAFVPAATAPAAWQPPTLARGDQAITLDIPRGATVQTVVTGSYQDRAAGFLRYTLPLSVVFALTVTLFACMMTPLLAAAAPVAVLRTFVLLFAMFCLSYLAMFAWHLRHTPEGQALRETSNTWRYLFAEQAHRHGMEDELFDRYLEGQ